MLYFTDLEHDKLKSIYANDLMKEYLLFGIIILEWDEYSYDNL